MIEPLQRFGWNIDASSYCQIINIFFIAFGGIFLNLSTISNKLSMNMEVIFLIRNGNEVFGCKLRYFSCLVGNIFYWQRNKRKIWSVCFFLHFITYLGNILSKSFYSAKRRYAWHVCNLLGCNNAKQLRLLKKNYLLCSLIMSY